MKTAGRNIPDFEELNKKERYMAYDALLNEHEEFETIEEAREYIREGMREVAKDEGIPDDAFHSKIYELKERVDLKTIAERKDYTEEDWEAEGYGDFDYVVEPQFKKVKKGIKNILSITKKKTEKSSQKIWKALKHSLHLQLLKK